MSTKRTADAARWTAIAVGIALTSIVMGIALMAFVGTGGVGGVPCAHPDSDVPTLGTYVVATLNRLF